MMYLFIVMVLVNIVSNIMWWKKLNFRKERCIDLERRIAKLNKTLRDNGYSSHQIRSIYMPEATAEYDKMMNDNFKAHKARARAY